MSGDREETHVGGYILKGGDGVYLLLDPESRDICGTIASQGGGMWKARTPAGVAVTLQAPEGLHRPALWVAEQIAGEAPDAG